jgi:tRNA A37 methylthiotransferase MiaB
MIDEINDKMITGRTEGDSLDIDGKVHLKTIKNLKFKTGDIIKVKVTKARAYDLEAEII